MSPVQQRRSTVKEVEIAMIDAAVRLTLNTGTKMNKNMAKEYQHFYDTIVAAYHSALEPAKS